MDPISPRTERRADLQRWEPNMRFQTKKALRETRHDEPEEEFGDDETSGDSSRRTPLDEPDDSSDLDDIDPDDERWDAFIADDDERDPQPNYGDFWPED